MRRECCTEPFGCIDQPETMRLRQDLTIVSRKFRYVFLVPNTATGGTKKRQSLKPKAQRPMFMFRSVPLLTTAGRVIMVTHATKLHIFREDDERMRQKRHNAPMRPSHGPRCVSHNRAVLKAEVRQKPK